MASRRREASVHGASARVLAVWPFTCRHARDLHLHSALAVTASHGTTGNEAETRKSGGRFPPPLFAVRGAHAAGWWSSLALSWVRVLRAVRSSAARIAIAAGSSMRSGSPCLSRERRASSAPALRISARSSGVSGRRGGRRVSCLPTLLSLTFFRSGLAVVLSVVGHHLPETTRRSDITSVPLLANPAGDATIRTRRNPSNITV